MLWRARAGASRARDRVGASRDPTSRGGLGSSARAQDLVDRVAIRRGESRTVEQHDRAERLLGQRGLLVGVGLATSEHAPEQDRVRRCGGRRGDTARRPGGEAGSRRHSRRDNGGHGLGSGSQYKPVKATRLTQSDAGRARHEPMPVDRQIVGRFRVPARISSTSRWIRAASSSSLWVLACSRACQIA